MKTVFMERGEKVRLDRISPEPPKGMTREKAQARLAALGEELFELQDAMWGAKVSGVITGLMSTVSGTGSTSG